MERFLSSRLQIKILLRQLHLLQWRPQNLPKSPPRHQRKLLQSSQRLLNLLANYRKSHQEFNRKDRLIEDHLQRFRPDLKPSCNVRERCRYNPSHPWPGPPWRGSNLPLLFLPNTPHSRRPSLLSPNDRTRGPLCNGSRAIHPAGRHSRPRSTKGDQEKSGIGSNFGQY